ncbi:MAG: hypothetical protein ACREUR_04260, partial [Nitrosospira sp.]
MTQDLQIRLPIHFRDTWAISSQESDSYESGSQPRQLRGPARKITLAEETPSNKPASGATGNDQGKSGGL